ILRSSAPSGTTCARRVSRDASILHFARIEENPLAKGARSHKKEIRMFRLVTTFCLMAIAAATMFPAVGQSEDTLNVAVGAPNNWDSGIPEIGRRAGIFHKHGLNLELLYTSGGDETLQAVISGSVDLGIGAGTGGVLGAFAKGPFGSYWRERPARAIFI